MWTLGPNPAWPAQLHLSSTGFACEQAAGPPASPTLCPMSLACEPKRPADVLTARGLMRFTTRGPRSLVRSPNSFLLYARNGRRTITAGKTDFAGVWGVLIRRA